MVQRPRRQCAKPHAVLGSFRKFRRRELSAEPNCVSLDQNVVTCRSADGPRSVRPVLPMDGHAERLGWQGGGTKGFSAQVPGLTARALNLPCADQSFARPSERIDACLAEAWRSSFRYPSFGAVLRDAGDLLANSPLARPGHIRQAVGRADKGEELGAAFVRQLEQLHWRYCV